MKTRGISILSLLAMLLALAGCGTAEVGHTAPADTTVETSETTAAAAWRAEAVQLPGGMVRARNLRLDGETVYAYAAENEAVIYAADLNGQDGAARCFAVAEADGYIADFCPTADGLWVMTTLYDESGGVETYAGTRLLHFPNDGTLRPTPDRTLAVDALETAPLTLLADGERLYLFETDTVTVLDWEGNEQFSLSDGRGISSPCFTADGRVAARMGEGLYLLDAETGAWSHCEAVTLDGGRLFDGREADLYWSDGQSLCALDIASGERTAVLSWLDVGIGVGMTACYSLGDGSFLAVEAEGGAKSLVPSDAAEETVTLTMATFDYTSASLAALRFNERQTEYKIVVRDYSAYNADENDTAGLEKLGLDIASGDAPDIYDLLALPLSQYVGKGLLEDLYPYIDADETLSRADYSAALLSAMEIGGGLYCLVPHVAVMSLMAAPENVPDTWDMAALLELAAGGDPFGGTLDRTRFIELMLAGADSPFVDWPSGTCAFDSAEFIAALELCRLLPDGSEESGGGACALYYDSFSCLPQIVIASLYLDCLDESGASCAVPVGLPGRDGARYLLCPSTVSWGMSAASEHKDGVWQFLREYLTEEYQASNAMPLHTAAFESQRREDDEWIESGGALETAGPDGWVELTIRGTAYTDALDTLALSATELYEKNPALMQIIMDESAAFFAGDKTAEQTAENIQSRASIFLAEQG